MAYFDSPKNRALWKKELESLRAERERRAANGFKPVEEEKAPEVEKAVERKGSKLINLEQLEAIEREAGGIKRVRRPEAKERAKARQARRELEKGQKVPEKSGKQL